MYIGIYNYIYYLIKWIKNNQNLATKDLFLLMA